VQQTQTKKADFRGKKSAFCFFTPLWGSYPQTWWESSRLLWKWSWV